MNTLALIVGAASLLGGGNLVVNAGFDRGEVASKTPAGYSVEGDARWFYVGYDDEIVTPGVAMSAHGGSGAVSQVVHGIDQGKGKWVRFTFRGLAEDAFKVSGHALFMKIDFMAGDKVVDSAERLIYREIEKDRVDFTINGDYGKGGAQVWRSYEFEELLPFPEIDSVRITVGFKNGSAPSEKGSYFFVDDFSLTQSSGSSTGAVEPMARPATVGTASTKGLTPLGGRWWYKPAEGEAVPVGGKVAITDANADRLFYQDDRLVNPFSGNMSAWLRRGYLDRQGNTVMQDRLVPDAVTITFDGTGSMRIRTHNIPNHPTARFPDTYGTQGYNPNSIQEQDDTYYLPLEPKPNPQAISLEPHDENWALPMGAVGLAVNGVIFYNPFDAGMTDATSIMDRCCGHPSPDYRYHYHKYPICVNTPFVDKGEAHSPVIGFAFDGFAVYGPYEAKGEMARDSKSNPLNAFNAHYDKVRGWHYHVTPGKFPYILGGYYGVTDNRNFRRGPGG